MRTQLTAEIKEAAAERLRREGVDGLTMRGIARDVEMSPAGLYRYYAGLDEILTELIVDGYRSLAESLDEGSRDATNPADRVAEVCRSYRRWAIAEPHTFTLLFGDPIPGYVAPVGGPTTQAMTDVSVQLMRPMVEAWSSGQFTIPEAVRVDLKEGGAELMDVIRAMSSTPTLPDNFGVWAITLWAWLHGVVSLELNGQFRYTYPDGAHPQFEASLAGMIDLLFS